MNVAPFLIRPTVFLDTNALHLMNTYLSNAQTYELPPYTRQSKDYDKVKAELETHLPQKIVEHLMNGCKTLAYLEQETAQGDADGTVFYTSRVCELEILRGVLEGRAHFRMASEGIPYRMRQGLKVLSQLVSRYLTEQDYSAAVTQLNQMFDELERWVGITINYAERENRLPVILELARLLQENVFLDVFDCWMYGCALVVQADRIITFDNDFKRVINKIHNPPRNEPQWLRLQQSILSRLREVFSVDDDSELALPQSQALTQKRTPGLWGEVCA